MVDERIQSFTLAIDDAALADLRRRLDHTRWPERETVQDWSQGAPLADVQALCDYWRTDYDWRRCEKMLNGFGQYRTEIDGLGIHFLHIRSPHADAMPMIMTHGWPGSVIEFHKVIGPLTDPVAHGGDAADAFHLVLPSLPGYGFSDKPRETGWSVEHIGDAWRELMRRLGYDRYVAQGGDWGSAVTMAIGRADTPDCLAVHLNMVLAYPEPQDMDSLTDSEQRVVADMGRHRETGMGYSTQQRTKPQTLGYGLVDSPAGQAAWIYEKLREWTDSDGDPRSLLTMDEMLDNIMLYWLPGNGASSARLYWESATNGFAAKTLSKRVGCSIFPREITRPSRRWAERIFPNLIYWGEPARGGHFAAFEQPDIFVSEVRNCFRAVRT